MCCFLRLILTSVSTPECGFSKPGLWSANSLTLSTAPLSLLGHEQAVPLVFLPTKTTGRVLEEQGQQSGNLNSLHEIWAPEELASLKKLKGILVQAQFTEAMVVSALQVDEYEGMSYNLMSSPQNADSYLARLQFSFDKGRIKENLYTIIRLFLLHRPMPRTEIEKALSTEVFVVLSGLHMFSQDKISGKITSTVQMVPLSDGKSHVITDFHQTTKHSLENFNQYPVMYLGVDSLALVAYTRRATPQKREYILDLCTGSGVQAIAQLANYAKRAVLIDISMRATLFARVNLYLNGYGYNSKVLKGDLYTVLDLFEGDDNLFDVITANPPYLPNPQNILSMELFGDGGSDGERILSAVVKGAGSHIEEGGSIFIVANLMSVNTYEERLRKWWNGGPASFEMYRGHIWSLDTYANMMDDGERLELIRKALEENGVLNAAAGFLFIKVSPNLAASTYKVVQPHTHLWPALAGFNEHLQDELLDVIGR